MFRDLPKFVFFTGKGGVGKTSLACATSLKLADAGKKTLLVSTDPASNVGQVFQMTIGNRIVAIDGASGLDALEINPEQAAADYRARIVDPMRGILPADALASIEEQLSGACTVEIAAFDEFTALLTDRELVDAYEHIVFDTAPTGHTLRLLKLPGAWSEFLEAGKGDASCLGPLAGLEQQRERYRETVARLSDGSSTLLVLVARPRQSALMEVARSSRELASIGIENQHLVVNGLMPRDESGDPLAEALAARDEEAIAAMEPVVAALPRTRFDLRPFNLVGLQALRSLASGTPPESSGSTYSPAHHHPTLGELVDGIERPGKGLVMFMGKGGVGKTTLAATVAVELAARGHKVLLTTTDPAAHTRETLAGNIDGLTVDRIDPEAETARYFEQVMATKGENLDAQGRAMLEEDLRSPCTEEIAVFQAFSRVIRESAKQFVIMDTAPTGHTLLLLDATGSYHREVLRHGDDDASGNVLTPLMQLQDPDRTKVVIVTLPETTPVTEAAALQEDLARADIAPWAWVVNASLAAASTSHPLLQQRAEAEYEQIEKVSGQLAERYAVVPMQAAEPIGAERLRALCETERPAAIA